MRDVSAAAAVRSASLPTALLLAAALLAGSAVLPSARASAQATSGARAEESRTLALAIQLERSGQPVEAERVLIELLGSQPTASQALSMLARLTEARGAPDVVLPHAEEAAERAGYDQAAIHQTYIRALAASGLADEALEEARAWVRARPSDVTGYAELSTTFSTLGRDDEAVETLLDARERIGDGDAFAQELAVLYERAGRYEAAASEWTRVLAWGDAGVTSVEAHLRTPGLDRGAVLEALETTITGPAVGVSALRGGLQLAQQLERGDWARDLAGQIVARAPREMRWQVLRRYYARARDAFPADARWAAGRLAADADSDADRLQWEAVEASLALELGDEPQARQAFERILEAAPRGSDARRLAINSLVVLRASTDDAAAERLVELHAHEYPAEEAERADLAIRLSKARVRRGDLGAAVRALDLGPAQPSDAAIASRLEAQRGHLALFRGQVERARQHLSTAGHIPGGNPEERTEILFLLDMLSRADSADIARLGQGIYELRAGAGPSTLVASARAWAGRSGDPAAAGLMRLGAGALAHDGFGDAAAEVRRELVEAFPASPEATGALLALARAALPERPEAARSWLQKLIIDHPDSALAPVARRLLSEIEGRVPSEGLSAPPERTL